MEELLIDFFSLNHAILQEMMTLRLSAMFFLPILRPEPDVVGHSLIVHNDLILLRDNSSE